MRVPMAHDGSLHYEEAGSGPCLLFNGDLGGIGQAFRSELEYWSSTMRAVLYDQRGCGDSDRPQREDAYSFESFVEDVRALLHALEEPSAVLYGLAWGGLLAQKFALTYPEMTRALILDSTFSEVNQQAAKDWSNRGRIVLEQGYAGLAALTQPPAVGGDAAVVALSTVEKQGNSGEWADPRAYFAQCAALASTHKSPLTPALKKLQVPALILGGWQDAIIGPDGSLTLGRALPKASLHMWQNTGFGVLRQHPEEVRRIIGEFFLQHGILPSRMSP